MYQQKPLRVCEGRLFLQAVFEGLSPQQIMLRELLIEDEWVIESKWLNDFLKDLGDRGSAEWLDTIRQSPDKKQAIAALHEAMLSALEADLNVREIEQNFVEGHVSLAGRVKVLVEENRRQASDA